MSSQTARSNRQAFHGILFIALLVIAGGLPETRKWPLFWAAPLVVYYLLVTAIPSLRDSFTQDRLGRITPVGLIATATISLISCIALLLFHLKMRPDVRALGAVLPVSAMGGVVLGGACFALVNATLEELAFRGVLFNAINSQWGCWMASLVTGFFFGWGHQHGYPPGIVGAFLAGIYGMALAWLRIQSGGLGLPIAAHIVADATIYVILVKSGAL